MPNSVLAGTSFTNLSRPAGAHELAVATTFSAADPPDRVCATLSRTADALPQLKPGSSATSIALGGARYRTTIGLRSPADDGVAEATFLRWIWYAARRARLHLDGADDDFSTTARVEKAIRTVAAAALRLGEGSFLGLSALTRQPHLAGAYALQEVTALEIDREHLEQLVMRKPLLLQDLGRLFDERRSEVRQVVAHERLG